jgi:hypothetical protein
MMDSVPIPKVPVNYKDILYKVFWTGVAAVLGTLATVLVDIDAVWSPFAIMAVNYLIAWLRQYNGTTAPNLPPPVDVYVK